MLDGLRESFAEDVSRKSGEKVRIGYDKLGLMERSDEVFSQGAVHACLASDSTIDLGYHSGWNLDDGNAPKMNGGDKAGEISYNSTTKSEEHALAIES